MKEFNTSVKIFKTRKAMGDAAGAKAEEILVALLKEKKEVRIIAAAAPSQNEILAYLVKSKKIDWKRVIACHMDEYVKLDPEHPAGFGNFLRKRFFGKVPFKAVNYLNGNAKNIDAECKRYSALIKKPVDLVLCGIGENGHLAFNDPPVADFNDPLLVKVVKLDSVCRNQQVHDGCFKKLDEVPKTALTLTVPALLSAPHVVCTVPAASKANAVKAMMTGPLTTKCPASALRLHPDCHIFLDAESGKYL